MGREGKKREIDCKKSERAVPKWLTLPVAARDSRSTMNAKITSIRSTQLVNSNCILIDYCAGRVLEVPPGARFKVLDMRCFYRSLEETSKEMDSEPNAPQVAFLLVCTVPL